MDNSTKSNIINDLRILRDGISSIGALEKIFVEEPQLVSLLLRMQAAVDRLGTVLTQPDEPSMELAPSRILRVPRSTEPSMELAPKNGFPLSFGFNSADTFSQQLRKLYLFTKYKGDYMTLRESRDSSNNCVWINTRHGSCDIRRPYPPEGCIKAKGLRYDLWNAICSRAGGSPESVIESLPEGVSLVDLKNGMTQHNAGSGYSAGLRGFKNGKAVREWLGKYFEIEDV